MTGDDAKMTRLQKALFAALMLFAAAWLLHDVNQPFRHYRDIGGATQGRIAIGYLRYGLFAHGLAPVFERVPKALEPFLAAKCHKSIAFTRSGRDALFLHYPPGLYMVIGASYAALGKTEAASRLPSIILSLAALLFVFLIVREELGAWTALGAAFFTCMTPMFLAYGAFSEYIVMCHAFALAGLFCYIRWLRHGKAIYFALMLLSLAIGCGIGWYAYFMFPMIALHHVLTHRKLSWGFFLPLTAAGCFCLILFFIYLYHVSGAAGPKILLAAFMNRSGDRIELPGSSMPFTNLQYLAITIRRIFVHFTLTGTLMTAAYFCMKKTDEAIRHRALNLLIVFGGVGFMPAILFKQGAFVHGYFLYMAAPFFGLGAALCARELILRRSGNKALWGALTATQIALAVSGTVFLANHLDFRSAPRMAKLVESVSDEKTVVASNTFDEVSASWVSWYTNRFILPREALTKTSLDITNNIPKGYRFVYIASPVLMRTNDMETKRITGHLYPRYGYRRVGESYVFDSSLPSRMRIEREAAAVDMTFGDSISLRLRGRANASDKTMAVDFEWRCLKPLDDVYSILAYVTPGNARYDHEPIDGLRPISLWRRDEVVRYSRVVRIPNHGISDEPRLNIALCSDSIGKCLRPKARDGESFPFAAFSLKLRSDNKPFVNIDRVMSLPRTQAYLGEYKMEKFHRMLSTMRYLRIDKDNQDILRCRKSGDMRCVERACENILKRLRDMRLVEGMIPAALDTYRSSIFWNLVELEHDRGAYLSVAKQLSSLWETLPSSAADNLHLATFAAKQPRFHEAAIRAAKRSMDIQMDSPDLRAETAKFFLTNGAPYDAYLAATDRLGVLRDEDIDLNTMFLGALVSGNEIDAREAVERIMRISGGEIFPDRFMNRAVRSGNIAAAVSMLQHLPESSRGTARDKAISLLRTWSGTEPYVDILNEAGMKREETQ